MKRAFILGLVACGACATAVQGQTPEPAFSLLCARVPAAGQSAPVLSNRLIAVALATAGVYDWEIVPDVDHVSVATKRNALRDPLKFCLASKTCGPDAVSKLRKASGIIDSFVADARRPVRDGAQGYGVTGASVTTASILTDAPSGISCINKEKPPFPPAGTGASNTSKDPFKPSYVKDHFFALRQSPSDLPISKSADDLESSNSARIAFTDDYVEDSRTIQIDATLGYVVAGGEEHWEFSATPYVAYSQNSSSKNEYSYQNIQNVVAGLKFSYAFDSDIAYDESTHRQAIDFNPQFTHSISTDSDVFSLNAVFYPSFLPYFQRTLHPLVLVPGHDLGFRMQVAFPLTLAYYNVIDAGTNPLLADAINFYRVGPRVNVKIVNDRLNEFLGIGRSLEFKFMYEYYWVLQGPVADVYNFVAEVEYFLNAEKNVSITGEYRSGWNLDTFQPQQFLSLGLGLKF